MTNQLLRLYCEVNGHKPRDWDPTGGDPRMGGPVALTICDLCGIELPKSESAIAFNLQVEHARERIAMEEEQKHVELNLGWWRRNVRRHRAACSCGWVGLNQFEDFNSHKARSGLAKAWSR